MYNSTSLQWGIDQAYVLLYRQVISGELSNVKAFGGTVFKYEIGTAVIIYELSDIPALAAQWSETFYEPIRPVRLI